MKKLHSFIKHLVAILLGTALVGMSVYAVQIPTSLNNAIQYIMQTIWTSDGTTSGTVNVDISTGGIYIRTGFLQNGNAWNNMSLGLDASGHVVYVPGSSSTPIFSLASNFIPKLDSLGSALEISVLYQSGGLIGINKTNPTRSVNILGDFLVEAQGSNVTYQYNFVNSNIGLGYPPIDINTAPSCACDLVATGADCTLPTFYSPNDQGYYCVDLTAQNNNNYYDHNVYIRQTIGIPSPVLSTSGINVGIRTNNPQAALHINGDLRIDTVPVGNAAWQVLVQDPLTNIISKVSPSLLGGNGGSDNQTLGLMGWVLSIFNGNNITLPTPLLSIAGNILTISGSTQNSVTLPTIGNNGWNITGNVGTNALTDYVGTLDNQDLVIKVNNTQIHKYYTNGSSIAGVSHIYTPSSYAVIAGGSGNAISGDYAVVGGGGMNDVLGYASIVLGGMKNAVHGIYSLIVGGFANTIQIGDNSVIVGGSGNVINGSHTFVGGGSSNTGENGYAAVVGGLANTADAYSFVGGGVGNRAIGNTTFFGPSNVVVGGNFNTAEGAFGFIGGGGGNTIVGNWATIPGGYQNTGAGDYSFAAGKNAIASGNNSFVWNDGNTGYNSNIYNNEFRVNSLWTSFGRATGWAYNLYSSTTPPAISATALFGVTITDYIWANGAVFANAPMISDQSLKQNISYANSWSTPGLDLVDALKPVTFKWKNSGTANEIGLDSTELHYGFIAQDVETVIPAIIRNLDIFDAMGLSSRSQATQPLKSIEITEMIPILVQAIKEQQTQITNLQSQIDTLTQYNVDHP